MNSREKSRGDSFGCCLKSVLVGTNHSFGGDQKGRACGAPLRDFASQPAFLSSKDASRSMPSFSSDAGWQTGAALPRGLSCLEAVVRRETCPRKADSSITENRPLQPVVHVPRQRLGTATLASRARTEHFSSRRCTFRRCSITYEARPEQMVYQGYATSGT